MKPSWYGNRKIIHVDMDAFYASVEILDRPELKGKPVIVGGSPKSRGVVSAASYEARKFGVRSAMSSAKAFQLCPQAVILAPRFERYKEISHQIHRIFARYTDKIEPLSLDEAWLDVTENFVASPSATWIAQAIKRQIKEETGLTASAGVSYNKFLAKIASDRDKPDGLFVIPPEEAAEFLKRLEVRLLPGVGRVTEQRLKDEGIERGWQLLAMPEDWLTRRFGKFGQVLYRSIRGIDEREVRPRRERKSIGMERTFEKDLAYGPLLLQSLEQVTRGLFGRAMEKNKAGCGLTLKVKFDDFHQITRSLSKSEPWSLEAAKKELATRLYDLTHREFPQKPIRLLGVSLSNFLKEPNPMSENLQLDLFSLIEP